MQHSHNGGYVPPSTSRTPEQEQSGGGLLLVLLLTVTALLLQGFIVLAFGVGIIQDHLPLFLLINSILAIFFCFTQPQLLLIAVVCTMPFMRSGPSTELMGLTFTPYTLGIILLMGLALIRKLLLNKPLNPGPQDFFLALICGSFLVSTMYAENITESGFLAFHAIFVPVLSLFVCRIMLDTEAKYVLLIRCFLITMVPFGLLTIMNFLSSGRRGYAPIDTGTVLLIPVVYFATTTYFPRLIRWAMFLVCTVAMVLTFSRVLMLVVVLMPFFYLAVRRGQAMLMYVIFFAFTLLFTLGAVGIVDEFKPTRYFKGDGDIHRSSERITNVEHWKYSIYTRIMTFHQGLERFMESPIFGTGLKKTFGGTTEHNFVVEWLQYGGITGYIFYIAFFLFHVARVGAYATRDPVLQTNLALLIGVLCNAFFNGIMHGFMPLTAFLVMGLSEARVSLLKRLPEDAEPATA